MIMMGWKAYCVMYWRLEKVIRQVALINIEIVMVGWTLTNV